MNTDTENATRTTFNQKKTIQMKLFRTILTCAIILVIYASIQFQRTKKFETHDNILDHGIDYLPTTSSSVSTSLSRRLSSPLGISSSDPNAPAIAWLMSFPDSGASYTSLSIQAATKRTIASNYGNMFMHPNNEIIQDQYASIPIYHDRPSGPYLFSELPLPDTYVLTKTHCGGHCTDCFPGRYLIGPQHFKRECYTSASYNPERARYNQGVDPFEYAQYDLELVKKAIHLIRDPFDNVISRFHREYKLAFGRGDNDFTSTYQYNSDGFHKWCNYLSDKFYAEEVNWYDQWNPQISDLHEISGSVTCHSEFYKYVQWHNNAIFVTDEAIKIPTLILHYESFYTDMDETLSELAEFLALDLEGKGLDFHYHTYDYFTREEIESITAYIRMLSTATLWNYVSHYTLKKARET